VTDQFIASGKTSSAAAGAAARASKPGILLKPAGKNTGASASRTKGWNATAAPNNQADFGHCLSDAARQE
jgi:hypothetical protein